MPIFNSARSATPLHNLTDRATLEWILREEPVLRQRTEAVRTAADPGLGETRLPGVCVDGPFQALPPHFNRGRCRGQCVNGGYRNTQHIYWHERTSVALVNIDDLQLPTTPNAVKALLRLCASAAALGWVSARGQGLKLGIVVTPTLLNNADNLTAWAAAASVVNALDLAGLTHDGDCKIDVTAASAQLAIMARNPTPLVRGVDPGAAIPWTPEGPSTDLQRQWNLTPSEPLAPAINMEGLEVQLPWAAGNRSNSMHRLGACAPCTAKASPCPAPMPSPLLTRPTWCGTTAWRRRSGTSTEAFIGPLTNYWTSAGARFQRFNARGWHPSSHPQPTKRRCVAPARNVGGFWGKPTSLNRAILLLDYWNLQQSNRI